MPLGIALYLVLIIARADRSLASGRLRRGGNVAVMYVVAMGLSPVCLGQHWLTNVAAGRVTGAGWVLGVVFAHRVWVVVRRGRVTAALPGCG